MATANTINDVIRLSQAYAAFDEHPTEVSMEDLEFVMGGSLGGLAKELVKGIPGAETVMNVLGEIPGAIDELNQYRQEYFPTDSEVQHSMAEGQQSAEAAYNSQYQVSQNAHAGDTRIVSGGYY